VRFEAGTTGAFSELLSQQKAVPALRFDNPNLNGNNKAFNILIDQNIRNISVRIAQ
jgi:hypothetical protein